MKIKLTNSFHKTEVFFNIPITQNSNKAGFFIPSKQENKDLPIPITEQIDLFHLIHYKSSNEHGYGKYTRLEKRIRKVLCGMKDCSCGIIN